jgi:nitroreductase
MDVLEAIYSRRATRAFTDQPVAEALLRKLIDAAIQAPSAVNRQAWSFSVIRDRNTLLEISAAAKAHMLQSSDAALSHHFQEILSDSSYDIFYHAPVLVVICATVESPWMIEDCALAGQNLMLAARNFELGSCWIGFAQSWLNSPAGKAALGLPSSYIPVAPIILGFPQGQPAAVPRKEPEIRWLEAHGNSGN